MERGKHPSLPRLHSTEIVIPSVSRWEDSQSLDSRSLETGAYSFLTPNQSIKRSLRPKQSSNSSAKVLSDGRVILQVPSRLFGKINPSSRGPTSVPVDNLFPYLPSLTTAAIHRPSGELSVSIASDCSQDSLSPRKKYTHRGGLDSLWGGDETTLEALEEHIKLESLAQQLQLEKEREEHLKLQEQIEREEQMEREERERQERAKREDDDEDDQNPLGFLNFRRGGEGGDSESGESDYGFGLRASLTKLAASKAREKLRNLAKYIYGHTNRKMLSCWNMIESRFKQSSVFKVVMTPDNQGLTHPVRHNALPVSALIRILCSSRVRVSHGEVGVMLERIGISESDVELGLIIAALNVVVQVCVEGNSDMAATYRDQMLEFLNQEKSMVSIAELREEVFSPDPIERETQLEEIKGRKQLEVAAMLAEKRKKDDLKLKQELSRKKLVDDFEKVLDQLQVMKRVFNKACAENFIFVVDFCRNAVKEYYELLSSKVPPDLVFFLGVEHFPVDIQHKVEMRMKRHHRENQQKFLDAGLNRSTSNRSLQSDGKLESGSISPSQSIAGSGVLESPSKAKNLSMMFDFEDFNDMRVESVTKVQLVGTPCVLASFRAMVALGRTFPRLSFRDAVEIMQYIAATKILACFRGHSRRWRYIGAREKWRKIFKSLRVKYYNIWADIVRHRRIVRFHCFRKLVAWRYYVRRVKERREAFRLCFWPFYVWRKFSSASATAKEKARFLVGRVMPTLTALKVFRAWKGYSMKEARIKHVAQVFRNQVVQNYSTKLFEFWSRWAHQRRRIRQAWYRKAKAMRRRNLMGLLKSKFLTWRIFVWFRVQMRKRVPTLACAFRKQLLPTAKVWRKSSYVEKRLHRALKRKQLESAPTAASINRSRKQGGTKRSDRRQRSDQSISSAKSTASSTAKTINPSSTNDDDAASVGSDMGSIAVVKFNPAFKWIVDIKSWLDVDSDGEDADNIPHRVASTYNDSLLSSFPISVDFLPFSLKNADQVVFEKFTSTAYAYRCRDQWNILDGAMRFHKYALLAFRNLRAYGKIKGRVRRYNERRKLERLRSVWSGWVEYAKDGGGPLRNADGSGAAASEAEVLYYQVRTHMSGKLLRTRKLVAEISKHYNKEAEMDSEDEEEKAMKQMKNLNLISDDNDDDFHYMEAEKQKAKQRAAEIKRKKEKMLQIYGDYQPPNVVDLDEKDRKKEFQFAEKMVKYSSSLTLSLNAMAGLADVQQVEAFNKRQRVNDMVDEVLTLETTATEAAVKRQLDYAQKFKEHAANNLITVLAKVYKDVQKKLIQDESKIYFRGLRLPMLIARSKKMLIRKKLRNYLRLCNRLRSLNDKAPFYHRARTMWVTFNRWIKFMSVSKMDPTPGLIEVVERKLDLHPDFHFHLQSQGYAEGSYCNDDEFRKSLSNFAVLFSRWKMYTQETLIFRMLRQKITTIFRFKLLRKCLWAMKTGLNCRDYSERIRHEPRCFPMTRLQADVDQILKRFLPMRREQLPTVIRRMNRMVVTRIKNMGRQAETFKGFLGSFLNEISLRVSTEQRLLHEAFEARGTQEFVDMLAPGKYHPVIPPIMTKLDGKAFYDPHINPKSLHEPTIPAGFRLSRVKWALQVTAGANAGSNSSAMLLGWQLVWSADGAPEVESPQRGLWHNAGISIQETAVPKEDFIIGLEYLYDGPTIVGVRLKLFLNGFTKWIGGRTSLSTLSVYMGVDQADIAPQMNFETHRRLDKDEQIKPALPYAMVVGLSGLIHNNRTTNLGLVIRKIRKQNVFSYFWVEDVLERLQLQQTDQGGFSVANGVDAHSVPSDVHVEGTSFGIGEESMTLEASLDEGALERKSEAEEVEEEEEEEEGEEATRDGTAEDGSRGEVSEEEESLETASPSATERRNQRMLVPRIAKKFAKWMQQDELGAENLTSPETQFFDILRMRMTELSSAKTRADEFARRIWTSRDVRTHPQLSKLVTLRVVAKLTRWFFNAISRRLIPFCSTERRGLYLFKLSRRLENKAKTLLRRARNNRALAAHLETSRHSWDGKPVLGPQERAAKKQLFIQVADLRAGASKFEQEAESIMEEAKENEDLGTSMLPRISLNLTVYNNFKTKIAAARHKESLLERMNLDQIKHGLFGSNMKETLLNKDQMQAIHASLRDRVIVMKDNTSLQRLVDGVLDSERALADRERIERNLRFPSSAQTRGLKPRLSLAKPYLPSKRSAPKAAPVTRLRRPSAGSQLHTMSASLPPQMSSVLNSLSYDDNDQV